MKYFVTGGSGFLGKVFEKKVKSKYGDFYNYDISAGRDILNYDQLKYDIKSIKPSIVVHAAAVADLYESDKFIEKNYRINVSGTFNIAHICSTNNIPLVYVSTCCAYGNNQPADEWKEPVPTEAYAWSKLAGEKVLGCVHNLSGAIARLGTFYGEGMRDTLFNAVAVKKILNDEEIMIHGDGKQTRQYIHVDDVAEGIYKICEYVIMKKDDFSIPKKPLAIFNVIAEQSYSVNDTIEIIGAILNKNPKIKKVGQREGQILSQEITLENTKFALEWAPKINYVSGMRRYIEGVKNG